MQAKVLSQFQKCTFGALAIIAYTFLDPGKERVAQIYGICITGLMFALISAPLIDLVNIGYFVIRSNDHPKRYLALGLSIKIAFFQWESCPLGTINIKINCELFQKNILRERDTRSLPFPMILSGTIVTMNWLVYGIIIDNGFMIVSLDKYFPNPKFGETWDRGCNFSAFSNVRCWILNVSNTKTVWELPFMENWVILWILEKLIDSWPREANLGFELIAFESVSGSI